MPERLAGYGGRSAPHYEQKRIAPSLSKAIRIALFLPLFAIYADCNCCCCDDPSGGGQEGGAPTPASCVQLSQQDCENIKGTLSARVDDIILARNSLYDNVIYEIQGFAALFFGDVINAIDSVGIDVSITSQYLDSENYQIQAIQGNLTALKDRFSGYKDAWSPVRIGPLTVSNLSYHTVVSISRLNNPYTFLTSEIHQIESLQNNVSNLANTNAMARSSIARVSSGLDSLRTLVTDGQGRLDNAVTSANQVYDNLGAIGTSIVTANGLLTCSACSGGGGGSGSGGGGTTIDITPIVQAVNSLNIQMQEDFRNLHTFLGNLFSDYDSARSRTFSNQDITYSTYAGLDNWFSRMELLLYKASGMDSGNTDDEPEDPSTSDQIQAASDDADTSQTSMTDDLSARSTDFSGLKERVVALYERFSFLGSASAPSSYTFVPDYAIGSITYNVVLESPHWLDIALSFVRYLFQAFYLLVFCSGIWYFVVILYRNGRKVLEFAIKIYAAVFGGGA